jgi:acyl-CoA dehydrogenase
MTNSFQISSFEADIRQAVQALCARFPDSYWRNLDRKKTYPEEFVTAMTKAGWLSILIPEEYGGGGLGISAAAAILEEVHRSGGNAAACHAQMYIMGTLLRHGTSSQKAQYLPRIASGELRLQAFGVTEPDAGSDTTRILTRAERVANNYVINGQKVFTSRAEHSDLLLLLARTAPYDPDHRTRGLSIFLVDLNEAVNNGLQIRPLETMLNHATTELFFENLEIPAENLIGEEGRGFRYILDGMNAERILLAAECIGDGRWFIDRAARYSISREVFGRPIGANQGVQFPLAGTYAHLEAANLMRIKAASLFDANQPCGPEANIGLRGCLAGG